MLRNGGVELTDDGFMGHAVAMGDADTIGAIFVVPAAAPAFRRLAAVDGWDSAVAFFPRLGEILDADLRAPIMAPAAMHGLDDADFHGGNPTVFTDREGSCISATAGS